MAIDRNRESGLVVIKLTAEEAEILATNTRGPAEAFGRGEEEVELDLLRAASRLRRVW